MVRTTTVKAAHKRSSSAEEEVECSGEVLRKPARQGPEGKEEMTTTNSSIALSYAKRRGIATTKRENLSDEGTVEELYHRLKGAGIKVNTKMRKAELVKLIEHNNRAASVMHSVDLNKLTPRQRRRLRKHGVS